MLCAITQTYNEGSTYIQVRTFSFYDKQYFHDEIHVFVLYFPMRLQFWSSFLETCTSLNLLHIHYTALAIYTFGSACAATARRTIMDHIINIWTFYSLQLDWNKREGCQMLSLSSVSTHNKVRPQHRELSALLFSNSAWVLLSLAEFWSIKSCETGPTVYRPYPRRQESLIICWCNYKGNTFYSVI